MNESISLKNVFFNEQVKNYRSTKYISVSHTKNTDLILEFTCLVAFLPKHTTKSNIEFLKLVRVLTFFIGITGILLQGGCKIPAPVVYNKMRNPCVLHEKFLNNMDQ